MKLEYLTFAVEEREKGLLGSRITERTKTFLRLEQQARSKAARTATATSAKAFQYTRPPNARPRRGRSSTGGRLRSKVNWKPTPDGMVSLDVDRLNREAPHWIIQEIGTGSSARLLTGGVRMARGRTPKNATYLRTVPRQRGRRIKSGLAFGTGPNGRFVAPGAPGLRQQLYPVSDLKGWHPTRTRQGLRRRGLVIRNEIKGQRFVQKGSRTAFREYRTSVRAAARSAFGGQKYRP